MENPPLPHRFPFELVEVLDDERVVLSVSSGSWWSRRGFLPQAVALEAMAQGAAVILGRAGEPADGEAEALYLAGIDAARFDDELADRPLAAGDVLEIRARLRIRLGPLMRLEAELFRDGRSLVEAAFTASAPPAPRRGTRSASPSPDPIHSRRRP